MLNFGIWRETTPAVSWVQPSCLSGQPLASANALGAATITGDRASDTASGAKRLGPLVPDACWLGLCGPFEPGALARRGPLIRSQAVDGGIQASGGLFASWLIVWAGAWAAILTGAQPSAASGMAPAAFSTTDANSGATATVSTGLPPQLAPARLAGFLSRLPSRLARLSPMRAPAAIAAARMVAPTATNHRRPDALDFFGGGGAMRGGALVGAAAVSGCTYGVGLVRRLNCWERVDCCASGAAGPLSTGSLGPMRRGKSRSEA